MKIHITLFFLLFGSFSPSWGEERFIVESDFGASADWVEPYLEDAWNVLVGMMDNPDVRPPRGIRVELNKDSDMRGIGGYASPQGIGFFSDRWPKDKDRLWITVHELSNLFAHHYGGGGGYPADWWSNGRSPFPEYASCLVMEKLGYKEAARYRKKVMAGRPDHDLFWMLNERYGFALFARFFKHLREDRVVLGGLGKSWPHPDETRSAYTIAYLSLAAGTNLAELIRTYRIGCEPPDWRDRHPEIAFVSYEVTAREVDDLLAVREFLFDARSEKRGAEILRMRYREGRLIQPTRTLPDGADKAESPIQFEVNSDFGGESEWTEGFLCAVATAFDELLGFSDGELPAKVQIKLRKNEELGGISGGAEGNGIDLISDQWPEEPFRIWILSQELACLICPKLGGDLPHDWWGHGRKPLAAYLSSLTLQSCGYSSEAKWIRDMHRDRPDHELFWRIHEKHGASWVPSFFRLLREDGIQYAMLGAKEKNPQPVRSLYMITYLSLATGENQAPLSRAQGIGKKPGDWDGAQPFKEYEITDKEVDRLMEIRERLFDDKKKGTRDRSLRKRYLQGNCP